MGSDRRLTSVGLGCLLLAAGAGEIGCKELRTPTTPEVDLGQGDGDLFPVSFVVRDSVGRPFSDVAVEIDNGPHYQPPASRFSDRQYTDGEGRVRFEVPAGEFFDVVANGPCCGELSRGRAYEALPLSTRIDPWVIEIDAYNTVGRFRMPTDLPLIFDLDSRCSLRWNTFGLRPGGAGQVRLDARMDSDGVFRTHLPSVRVVTYGLDWAVPDVEGQYSNLRGSLTGVLPPWEDSVVEIPLDFKKLQLSVTLLHPETPRARATFYVSRLADSFESRVSFNAWIDSSWVGSVPAPPGPVRIRCVPSSGSGIVPFEQIFDLSQSDSVAVEMGTHLLDVQLVESSGRPILGEVKLFAAFGEEVSLSTGSDGAVRFFAESGDYSISGRSTGYVSEDATFRVDADRQITLVLELQS